MQGLKIVQWNCFKLTDVRIFLLDSFLKTFNPDIISLQEIKLDEAQANLKIRFDSYVTYHKTRSKNPCNGGGVAILIKDNIPHSKLVCDDS